ncbi:MAG: metallophosphoesterase [Thermoleophilaceae bacterium]
MRARVSTIAAVVAIALLVGCGAANTGSSGSTLRATWVDPGSTGALARGPAEPFVQRTDLASASRSVTTLATLGQITDAHVRDEESPARVPFLDRLGAPFNSTFRPQEALSTQVLTSIVRSLDAEGPQAVVETGDLIDNDQQNELRWATTALRGGQIRPDSGAPGYDGVQSQDDPDPLFYRPDVDAPRHPGLLHEAQQPFRSPGLDAPWYPVLGNHDLLVQGELAPTAATERIATGRRRVLSLDPNAVDLAQARRDPARAVSALLAGRIPGETQATAPDPSRRELPSAEVAKRLTSASRHGSLRGGRLDYTFDVGASVRGIVLDTIDRISGSEGVLSAGQLSWLRSQLRAAGARHVIVFAHQPLDSFPSGTGALALLDRDPHVIAVVAGNTHRNRIEPRRSPAGGYWQITTSSLADWPQQARMLRLVRTASGRLALETWMVDGTGSPLADTARALAYLDAQGGRPQDFAGTPADRNAVLYLNSR